MADVLILFFVVVFMAGCTTFGTYNPATGRNEFIVISTANEIAMGEDINNSLNIQYEMSSNKEFIERVEGIGARVVQVSDRQDYEYHFFVIEKDELNAFTTPGGNIYIFTGLLNKLKKDDQLASVIAHEVGHCAARHVAKKFQTALGYDIISNLILDQFDSTGQAARVASLSSGALMKLVFSAYSRKDEYEADRLGIKYMYLSGFDLGGVIEALTILKEESTGGGTPILLRSHPYLKDRIKEAQKIIEGIKSKHATKS